MRSTESALHPSRSGSRSHAKPHGAGIRWSVGLWALVLAALGVFLVLHYPVAPWVASLVFVACCVAFFVWPDSWLIAVPLLLPLIGFAPWTGWITFEELDLLVLAAAVGGYARLAWPSAQAVPVARQPRSSAGAWLLLLLFAASTLVAMARGFADAGGFSFGWFQGYHEPMNSLRLAKSFFLALLVMPLWRAAVVRRGAQAPTWLAMGLMLGLAGASLATVWERMAFVGLFNFSTDYRTTGLFWEMHVGGAALDGFLALLMPFVLRELFVARSHRRWAAVVACLGLAGYACLTTFSRGVYLAVPVGLAVTVALCLLSARRQLRRGGPTAAADVAVTAPKLSLGAGAVLLVLFGGAVLWTFPSSGYRGLLALLGAAAVAMPLAGVLRRFKAMDWMVGLVAGVLLSLALWAGAMLGSKASYLGYGACLLLTLALLFASLTTAVAVPGKRVRVGLAAQLALAGFMAVLVGAGLVAEHWGYARGGDAMLPVLVGFMLLTLVAGASPKAVWPTSTRWQATSWAGMAMLGGIVSIFGGGAYMSERFSTTSSDMDTRVSHWTQGWNMLSAPLDPVLGKGMGRYPASYYLTGASTEHPGDYRLKSQNGNTYLVLGGGKQQYMGWGEILRVSQRIRAPEGPVTVALRVRTANELGLHLEVCEKHLLYNGGCILASTVVKPMPGVWQDMRVPLAGNDLGGSNWFAPRLVAFSIATDTALGLLDVDNIQLLGPDGRQLLDNGDFSADMQRWFFSSDRNHLPWHIKNVFMNVLFDQGGVGLLLFSAMLLAALWRVTMGSAKDHPLAPGIGGGLVGFVLVGLFDSLVDVPRLAFVFYVVLLLGLTVRQATVARSASSGRR
ncbi:hypothetical protein [Rhodoferax sp.]|uniref:hypothetical protein n=1 Tax=Rhodoferax sp. TaxID=50421 RepID=UPI0025FB95B0|nr:hypothetical protein [Rhodoferax sp.]